MKTKNLTLERKQIIGRSLRENAIAQQWEQLRTNVTDHGHMKSVELAKGNSVFTVDRSTLIDLAAITCSDAEQIFPKDETKLVFIKDFEKQVGIEGEEIRTKMCVVVDLANVSEGIDPLTAEEDVVVGAYFTSAYPCK